MYISIWYTIGIVDMDNFLNNFGETLHLLNFKKSYMHYIFPRREYMIIKVENIYCRYRL
jgi:hypothetical protein